MPVFTAIAAGVTALAGAVGFGAAVATAIGGVAAFAARTLLTIGISKLISNRQGSDATGTQDAGARVQLPPATDNKLPVIYGSAYIAPVITDAKISTDQKTMWYVCALTEVTDTGTISFGEVYYDSKLVTFDGSDPTKVVSLTTNSDPAQVDTKVSGNLYMYFYNNGSSSPTNTSQTAIQVLQDAGIDPLYQWTSTDIMDKTAFVIVKVNYNQDAGTTNIGQLSVQTINSLSTPGEVIYDYMTNTRYGCSVPATKIDTASLTALNTYSNYLITYYPVGGGTATQPRYRINGPLNTGNNCLNNIQQLVDACDSWLQYSELTGKWKVVVNKGYDQAPNAQTLNDLYSIDSSVLIGGIEVNPIDLNNTFNSMEVQYPNFNINDQTDFRVIDLTDPSTSWYNPDLLSPNEPKNRLTIQYPQVNTYIQAMYLGIRRLLQSREDLVINCALDYSGIQLEAGDVVKVTLAEYGWTNKLFRVSQVQEAKLEDGSLGARIVAFEYNSFVFADDALDDFVPEANTGLTDPNIISQPGTPVVTTLPLTNGNVKSFSVSSTVPVSGTVLYMDFNYGTTNDVSTHKLYKTVSKGNGTAFTAGETITIEVNDLPAATYYWSVTARNNGAGSPASSSSSSYVWAGPGVTSYNSGTNTGGVSTNNIAYNAITINQMAPAAAGFYQRTTYDMRTTAGGPAVLVTSTSTRNVPLIYPGTTVPSNEFNTWEAGTWPYYWTSAPSGLGYYTPNIAQTVGGTETELATVGWYKLVSVDLSGDVLTPTEWAVLTGRIGLQSDTIGAEVQICRFASFASGLYSLQLRTISDFVVPQTGQYTYQIPLADGSTGSSGTIYEYGWFIRNVTPASNITVTSASLTVKQNK